MNVSNCMAVGNGNVTEIAQYLETGLVGLHTTKIYTNASQIGDEQVMLQVFERYYHRNKQRATLTVLVSGKADNVRVEAVAAGGGGGLIMRVSLGANSDFSARVAELLLSRGFKIIT